MSMSQRQALEILARHRGKNIVVTTMTAVGIWPEFFAYPYGHWDPRVRAFVLSAGYRAGLTLDAGLNDAPDDLWCLRRVNISAAISDAAFQAWAVGLQGWRRD